MHPHVAHASVKIHAKPERVWDALTNPDVVRRYMGGTNVDSNWTAGSPITWRGEMRGRSYEDRGKILRAEPCRILEYTHYSPMQGAPDSPENVHTVTIELDSDGLDTKVSLTQEGNPTEEARKHNEANWREMLKGLRQVVEEEPVGSPARLRDKGRERERRSWPRDPDLDG